MTLNVAEGNQTHMNEQTGCLFVLKKRGSFPEDCGGVLEELYLSPAAPLYLRRDSGKHIKKTTQKNSLSCKRDITQHVDWRRPHKTIALWKIAGLFV